MPWFRRYKDYIYWLDRAALVCFALSANLYLLDNNIWWSDLYNFLIDDITSKTGYMYVYQTFIAASVAFFAALIAYLAAHYKDKKNSYIAVSNIMSLTNEVRGEIWFIADAISERKNDIEIEWYIENMNIYADKIDRHTGFFLESGMVYNLNLEVEPNVSIFIVNLKTLAGMFRSAKFYIDSNNNNQFSEDFIDRINDCRKVLDSTYMQLDKYKDKEFCQN